jgi:hypothetical protein
LSYKKSLKKIGGTYRPDTPEQTTRQVAAIDPIGGGYLMDRWRLSLRAPEEGDKTTKKIPEIIWQFK